MRQQVDEDDIGPQVDADHDQRNPQRGDHVLQGIEDADQQRRRRLPGESQAEEGERERGLPHGVLTELAALEEHGDDRHPENRQADGGRHQDENIQPQGERGAMPDRVDGANGRVPGQEWEQHKGERLGEGAQRQLGDRVGIA